MILQSNIENLAKERGFTSPAQLTFYVKLSPQTLYNNWNGIINNTRLETLYAIAKKLNVSIEDLFEEVEDNSNA